MILHGLWRRLDSKVDGIKLTGKSALSEQSCMRLSANVSLLTVEATVRRILTNVTRKSCCELAPAPSEYNCWRYPRYLQRIETKLRIDTVEPK
jgi:hypothetical protein